MNRQLLFFTPLLIALSCPAAEPARNSDEFRKEFLARFHRTSLNTAPEDAALLRVLIEGKGAKRGIEIGTASGFGAMNMGWAFERTGGHLYSLEIDPGRAQETRDNVAKLGLDKTVTVIDGDALKSIPALTGEFDFIFIDANKPDYLKYLKAAEPKLKKGALVVADNVIVSARAMADYLQYVNNSPDYDTVTIRASMEKNDGMAITTKLR
jgi:predicted O-methyltransferase YrrM